MMPMSRRRIMYRSLPYQRWSRCDVHSFRLDATTVIRLRVLGGIIDCDSRPAYADLRRHTVRDHPSFANGAGRAAVRAAASADGERHPDLDRAWPIGAHL